MYNSSHCFRELGAGNLILTHLITVKIVDREKPNSWVVKVTDAAAK